jgi:short-subunit dehydrogenase
MSANEIRNAAVTGAGDGIGRAIALALLGEGMLVWLIGRDQDKLEPVAKQGHRRARLITADLATSDGISKVATALGPRLDVLAHSAGGTSAVIGHRSALTNGRRSNA